MKQLRTLRKPDDGISTRAGSNTDHEAVALDAACGRPRCAGSADQALL